MRWDLLISAGIVVPFVFGGIWLILRSAASVEAKQARELVARLGCPYCRERTLEWRRVSWDEEILYDDREDSFWRKAEKIVTETEWQSCTDPQTRGRSAISDRHTTRKAWAALGRVRRSRRPIQAYSPSLTAPELTGQPPATLGSKMRS